MSNVAPIEGIVVDGSRPPRQEQRHRAGMFLLLCVIALAGAALVPESALYPLNRITALQAGKLLQLLGLDATVSGTILNLANFNVRVVGECTILQVAILFVALVATSPVVASLKIKGVMAGIPLLQLFDSCRIALLTHIGATRPQLFEAVHVYLGQVLMLGCLILICTIWLRATAKTCHSSDGSFLVKFLVWSALLFPGWLAVNLEYVKQIDWLLRRLYSLIGYQLIIPYENSVYYQTFSLVPFTALILAATGWSVKRRIRLFGAGLAVLTTFHLLERIGNVMLTAFQAEYAVKAVQMLSGLGQFLLPVFLWLAYQRRESAPEQKETECGSKQ